MRCSSSKLYCLLYIYTDTDRGRELLIKGIPKQQQEHELLKYRHLKTKKSRDSLYNKQIPPPCKIGEEHFTENLKRWGNNPKVILL